MQLQSLQYFISANATLTTPHPIWSTAVTSSFETRKATVLARMASGRFRTDYLARHWSGNRQGYCLAHTCHQTAGDLQHLLTQCPALEPVRQRMWDMFCNKSVQFPALLHFLQWLEKSSPDTQIQFLLDPTAFQEIWEIWELFGQPVYNHVYYLTRTYVYYIYRQRQIMTGFWTTDRLITKSAKRRKVQSNNDRNTKSNPSLITGSVCVSASHGGPDNPDQAPAVQVLPDPGQAAQPCDPPPLPAGYAGPCQHCGGSACAKCHYETSHLFRPSHGNTRQLDQDIGGEHLPFSGPARSCGGGAGGVPVVARTTFTPYFQHQL